jgi:hypothetical protein
MFHAEFGAFIAVRAKRRWPLRVWRAFRAGWQQQLGQLTILFFETFQDD